MHQQPEKIKNQTSDLKLAKYLPEAVLYTFSDNIQILYCYTHFLNNDN